ncbi:hypothetical protein OAJ13_01890 [Euryarchaeota archaeon]|nr:hypothetical protein [Euryarchaeota archaeon]
MCAARPKFFVALAHTDTIAYFSAEFEYERIRVSNLNLFPEKMKENLLFSMSFDSAIHYDTMESKLDPLGDTFAIKNQDKPPKRIFADCGAFQFRNLEKPILEDGVELDHNIAWSYYEKKHVLSNHQWEEILLCSPDHIITPDLDDKQVESRYKFIRENAAPFLQHTKKDSRISAVGVIHGRNNDERMSQYEMFKNLGYDYVALGGMVPYSTKQEMALNIIAGIYDMNNPKIDPNSILGKCRSDGIKLHIFGLNSPEWVRWWYRLNIDSFDGSKLSTEGAANGWYYIANDGKGIGRNLPDKPESVKQLYQRIAVKKMGAENWQWLTNSNNLSIPVVPITDRGVDTSCNCPACQYLTSARCTSQRCWYHKMNPDVHHIADPRMMGSTEHNMGRVSHNAFVFSWIISQIEYYNTLADNSVVNEENSWLRNWRTIEVKK